MVALERDGPGAREKAKKESCMQEQRKERSTTYLVNATRNNEQGDFTNGKTKLDTSNATKASPQGKVSKSQA
jgi:hypothetical protein